MASISKNYDPEKYGQMFELMPEGVYYMKIVASGYGEADRRGNPRWELELQPEDPRYASQKAMKLWLYEDGCINALCDAADYDPAKVDSSKDYPPGAFIDRRVWAEVYHYKNKDDKIFANIRRLYPAFHKGVPPRDGMTIRELEAQRSGKPTQPTAVGSSAANTDFRAGDSGGFAADTPF